MCIMPNTCDYGAVNSQIPPAKSRFPDLCVWFGTLRPPREVQYWHMMRLLICVPTNGFLFFTHSYTTCAFNAINSSCRLGKELCECFTGKWQGKNQSTGTWARETDLKNLNPHFPSSSSFHWCLKPTEVKHVKQQQNHFSIYSRDFQGQLKSFSKIHNES